MSNDLNSLVNKNAKTPKNTAANQNVPEPVKKVSDLTELEREMYLSVIQECIRHFASLQGFRVSANRKWWESSLSQAHELANLTVLAYRESKDADVLRSDLG